MSVITITRALYSHGKEIAQNVSEKMGYVCIGHEVIEAAANEYNVPAAKMTSALERAPSLFGMSADLRRKYIAYFQATLIRYIMKDNIVYHGPAGHILIQGVSHILKVCIVAPIADRVLFKTERDGVTEKEARKVIDKEDKEHRDWAKTFYNIDDSDPSLYDIVLNLGQINIEDAVRIISDTASAKKFQPMTYSIGCIANIELACRVRVALIDLDPTVNVRAVDGEVFVHTRALDKEKDRRTSEVRDIALRLPGVTSVEVQVTEDFLRQISSTDR
ncbi:MAG: cytidylate kinase-like family protein [Nitrospirae bacterium]|nr:cytidylate kinase-like family protein [Nitrospirota bacterium]